MALTKSTVYTTTDGKAHPDFKAARKAQDVIDRAARLKGAFPTVEAMTLGVMAMNGPELLAALTLPSTRGKRKQTSFDLAAPEGQL
jgi:hypothetical protein